MVTLYKRATPTQRKILRIIEGSIKNAADAHPDEIRLSEKMVRSIAKRAAGTLSAEIDRLIVLAATHDGGQPKP